MEDGSASRDSDTYTLEWDSLNPCSNGRCSASMSPEGMMFNDIVVLILVLMEDALRDFKAFNHNNTIDGLNPCSNGRCSARAKFKTC